MRGIYFINNQIELAGHTKEESFGLQEQALVEFIYEHKLQVIKLNPYQLNQYYTILHALFYDLRASRAQLDCFAFYSEEVLVDFIRTYPARWLVIKSYFNQCMSVCS